MTESISALIMAFRDLVSSCGASLALSSSQCVLGGCLGTREHSMCVVSVRGLLGALIGDQAC